MHLRSTPALLGVLLFAVASTPAHGAVTSGGFGYTYTAAENEVNHVTVSTSPNNMHLRSTENGMGATNTSSNVGGCLAVPNATNQVDCPGADHGFVIVQLLDRDDTFVGTGLSRQAVLADGGPGKDTITGGSADDAIGGASGNDTLHGGPGDDVFDDEVDLTFGFVAIHSPGEGHDTMNGDSGDDTFLAGTDATTDGTGKGSDHFNGGADVDTADYSTRVGPVVVTIDAGAGNDGAQAEGDTIVNAERLLGGLAGDDLTGGTAASTVIGGPGADTLRGRGAADRLVGGTEEGGGVDGDDVLDGGGGPDVLIGGLGRDTASYASRITPVVVTIGDGANDGAAGEGDDVRTGVERLVGGTAADTLTGDDGSNDLAGGEGADVLVPGGGADSAAGGTGDDRIEARDGAADVIACGDGADTVIADLADDVAADCESIDRPAAAGAGGTGQSGDTGGNGSGTGSTSTTGSGSNGPGTGTGTGPGATDPKPPAPILSPEIVTKKLTRKGRRVRVAVGCPGTADCAGDLTLLRVKGRKTLAKLPYGVPAGAQRTFTLSLSAKALRQLEGRRKQPVSLSVARTGAPSTTKTGAL